jgi:hypothetical protein
VQYKIQFSAITTGLFLSEKNLVNEQINGKIMKNVLAQIQIASGL